jgi:hypothetical protein
MVVRTAFIKSKSTRPVTRVPCGRREIGSEDNFRVADDPPSESDTANTRLIESGNPLTVRLPDVWYQPVTHLLEIFLVALQIACQQLLLTKDP